MKETTHIKDFTLLENKELLKVYKTYDDISLTKNINALKYKLLQIRIKAATDSAKDFKFYNQSKKMVARLYTELNARKIASKKVALTNK